MYRYPILNALSDIQHMSTSAMYMQTLQTSHPDPYRCRLTFCAHAHTPRTCDIPVHSPPATLPPIPADITTPALGPSSCFLRLCPPCQPHPTSCPAPCPPSPGLLSCRMMARKKSWENMALVASPSCLHPPSSQPLQPSQLGSQPGAGLQRKAHPAPFAPGQSACQARSSSAWSSLGRGQDHQGRGPLWGEKGGCSGDPSPFSRIFSFQSWLPSPNPKSPSHPIPQ